MQGFHRLIAPLARAAFNSGQLNAGHRRLEHWVGIKWKCMLVRDRLKGESAERIIQGISVRKSLCEVPALKAGEYSTWWQWVPKLCQPLHLTFLSIPQFFHLKQFYVSPVRGGISWSRYTSFFLQWVTDPLKPFHAVSHWLTHLFYLPSAIHYLHCQWKDILLSLTAFFSACIKWRMPLLRMVPSSRPHTYL